MTLELEELQSLEILELGDGGTYEVRPTHFKLGKKTIHTIRQPEGKEIQVLRLWVDKKDKQVGPNYWDITSQTLIAQMLPYFAATGWLGRTFKITKHGIAPRARFTLAVI